MRKIVYFLFIILAVNFAGLAKEYSPQDIKNPNIADRRQYVADPEDLVSSRAKSEASAILWNLRQKTGVEVAEVIIPNTGEYTKEEFATRLFDNWKIGKSDKDNGVLILIVTDQREAWIATGYGVEGVIPDISATKIVNRSIVPYMKQGNLNEAVVAVAADVANILSNPEAASELKSNEAERWNQASETDITGDDILAFALSIIVFMGLGSYIIYFYEIYFYTFSRSICFTIRLCR